MVVRRDNIKEEKNHVVIVRSFVCGFETNESDDVRKNPATYRRIVQRVCIFVVRRDVVWSVSHAARQVGVGVLSIYSKDRFAHRHIVAVHVESRTDSEVLNHYGDTMEMVPDVSVSQQSKVVRHVSSDLSDVVASDSVSIL